MSQTVSNATPTAHLVYASPRMYTHILDTHGAVEAPAFAMTAQQMHCRLADLHCLRVHRAVDAVDRETAPARQWAAFRRARSELSHPDNNRSDVEAVVRCFALQYAREFAATTAPISAECQELLAELEAAGFTPDCCPVCHPHPPK